MPELPEVETVARGVARLVTGRTIESVVLLRADIAHGIARPCDKLLRGRKIDRVSRQAKHIRIDLAGGLTFIVHLGMTGRLSVSPRELPPPKHTHLRIRFAGHADELRFCDPRRFGGVWLIDDKPSQAADWIGRRLPPVGADPLSLAPASWSRLMARPRQIKALLLDQQPISGVGNIYCDESLHRAGIHPLSRAGDLPSVAVRRLYRELRRVLREAIAAGGSSVSDYRDAAGEPGWFQIRHRVYGREGQPCKRCRTPIEKLVVAGRGTHLCPRCQPRI